MPWYLIFHSGRRDDGLRWNNDPVGAFKAANADEACKAAARKRGVLGTYFAVEGLPWGAEMLDTPDVEELGESEIQAARRQLEELERRFNQLPSAEGK